MRRMQKASTPPDAEVTWQLPRGCKLLWRLWADEYVVYNTGSGDTHVLDPFAGDILKKIERQSSTSSRLSAVVSEELGDPVPGLGARIDELLEHFSNLGLIEPALQ